MTGATIAVALGALLTPLAASANPLDTYGFGSRSVSLGGAVTADVEDFSATYYNPAGLVRGTALRLEAGYFLSHHELRLDGRDTNVDDVRGVVAGLVAPGRVAGLPFAFGVALHLNDERLSRTRSLPQIQPRWEMYDNRTHRIFIASELAIRPWPWLLLGGGIAFMSATQSSLAIRGELDAIDPERGSRFEHTISGDLTAVRYPHLGIQIVPDDQWSFGIAYRGEFQLRLAVDAVLDGEIAVGDMRFPGYFSLISDSVNAFLPQQVAFGVAWRPTRRWRIGLDATWVDWSAYRSPVARTEVELDIEVPPSLADRIRVPDAIPGTIPEPPRFEDRVVPRLGVEWLASEGRRHTLHVRSGAFYEISPVPPQTGVTNFVDCDRFVLSTGLGLALRDLGAALPGDLLVDAHFSWSHLIDRTTRKQSLIDPIGDYRAGGDVYVGGVTVGVTFP